MQTTLSIYGESLPKFMKKVDIAECLAVINIDTQMLTSISISTSTMPSLPPREDSLFLFSWLGCIAEDWFVQNTHNTDFRYKNKMPYHVADPYVWDESYQVYVGLTRKRWLFIDINFFQHTRLDDEHVILFNLMQELGENPEDVDLLNKNRDVYRDHFDYEEKWFMASGCRNTTS